MTKRDWSPLHARVHQDLLQRRLLARGARLLLAVSGGQDSLCLLQLVADLRSRWSWQVGVAHCDHRWSSDWGLAAHVEAIVAEFGFPFYLQVAPPLKETEAAAREWRYQALSEIALQEGFTAVLTGHTQSDRAETVLYNLIRGAGTDGLQALDWQRPLAGAIPLVRPLLAVARQETLALCQQYRLPVWEDAANRKLRYARNRLRQVVIPYLQTHFNPQVETALARSAEILTAEVEELENRAASLFEGIYRPSPQPSLPRSPLQQVSLALQRRVMRRFLEIILQRQPSFEQIEALTRLIDAPNRTRTASLPGDTLYIEVAGDSIVAVSRNRPPTSC